MMEKNYGGAETQAMHHLSTPQKAIEYEGQQRTLPHLVSKSSSLELLMAHLHISKKQSSYMTWNMYTVDLCFLISLTCY